MPYLNRSTNASTDSADTWSCLVCVWLPSKRTELLRHQANFQNATGLFFHAWYLLYGVLRLEDALFLCCEHIVSSTIVSAILSDTIWPNEIMKIPVRYWALVVRGCLAHLHKRSSTVIKVRLNMLADCVFQQSWCQHETIIYLYYLVAKDNYADCFSQVCKTLSVEHIEQFYIASNVETCQSCNKRSENIHQIT